MGRITKWDHIDRAVLEIKVVVVVVMLMIELVKFRTL